MSKKILKRSLALGALMAFVITGSAMAAETIDDAQIDDFTTKVDKTVSTLHDKVAVKQSSDCNVSEVAGAVDIKYVVKIGNENGNDLNGDDHSTKALGQGAQTGGKDLTFANSVKVYHESDSVRNTTGNASIFGIDTYEGIWTFNGITDVTVKSTDAQDTGSAISATGIRTWGLTWNDDQNKYVDGSSQIILNGDTTVYVSGVDASLGINPSSGKANPLKDKPGTVTGIGVDDNANITAKKLDVTVESLGGSAIKVGATAYGVNVEAGTANFNGETKITSTSNYGNAYGVRVDGEGFTMTTGAFRGDAQVAFNDDLTINATGAFVARGVEARNGSNVSIGNDAKTNNVTINAVAKNENASDDWVIGVFSRHDDSIIDIKGDTVTINAIATGTNMASGILANTTKDDLTEKATLEVDANNIVITAEAAKDGNAVAITTMSGSEINIKGNLTANGDKVIYTRGNAKTVINESGKDTVVLNGDIAFAKGYTDADKINATVEINLNNAKSEFNGAIYTQSINGERNTFTSEITNGAILSFSNGAKWNLKGESIVNNATFGAGSVLKIDADTYAKDTGVYALNGVGNKSALKVENDAKIVIDGGKLDGVYNVAKDFATNEGKNWTLQADDVLWYVDWTDLDKNDNTLQGTIKVKSTDTLVEEGIATNDNKEILSAVAKSEENVNPTVDAIKELTSVESNLAPDQQQKAIAAVLQVGEAGGFTGNVVSVSKQVNGSVGARNSFSGPKHGGPRHRGGHGPSVTEEANGSAIWAQYVHGKDKVDGIDMGGVENAYESQFNGVVLGADFKQVGSYASGIAFNYGEGDSHSKKNVVQSDSEFDFWGVSYYGAVKKQDTNFIFDIGYSESDSDVEQVAGSDTITANPEASTWTAGVKVEKLIDKGAVQIVPYAGLRFMTIDTDEYEAKGSTSTEATYYSTERQNIWLLPVGVSLSQENVYDSGWIVTPKADFSYTWAMGDTDSSMTVNMPGVGYYDLGYTVMDDGSFMATVGLDAQKEDWTFGVAYSYQKGDSTRSDRWYVNARYSF